MTKSDIALLLSPSVFLAVLAVAGYFTSEPVKDQTKEDGYQQKFETFVTNVKSGKWQLTPDRWLEGMRHEHAMGESYREACLELHKVLLAAALTGMVAQATAVVAVLRRMRKAIPLRAPDTP